MKDEIELLYKRPCPWIDRENGTIRQFRSVDPDLPHCRSKEALCGAFGELTGLPEKAAEAALNRLFAFQPSLTYGKRGALCKKSPLAVFSGPAMLPPESVEKSFPPDWRITLQIPEELIDLMVWSCWRYDGYRPLGWRPCFAEKVLRLLKARRGAFLQEYSKEKLEFFWFEYGSMFI